MSKGEDVMKPNKEQKGNHSVLVIAVGKHPKMGPGERNYKKDKSMKKAFNVLKQKKTRAEREQAYRERQARREQRAKEMDAYNAGTASEEVKQKIDQARANRESGVNQNLRYANKQTGGSSRKKMPKKPFDTSHFDRWVKNYSLGENKGDTNLSNANITLLARKLGMNPSSLRSKNFEGVDIGKLKDEMQKLGKQRYEQRRAMVGVRRNIMDDDGYVDDPYTDEMHEEYNELLDEKHGKKTNFGVTDEEREQKNTREFLERLGIDADTGARRADFEDADDERMEGANNLMFEPSGHTIPFGASGGVEGGRKDKPSTRTGKTLRELGPRGRGEATFQEEYSGFTPPVRPTKLSNPLEEEEEADDFPEYGQFTLSEPMDLAFRLLKDEQKEKTFMRQCAGCGQMKGPRGVCKCERR
tara:strand:- start:4277 stop:5518 length:1242 start_codon:yes stop_codon:yes gene_type:complete